MYPVVKSKKYFFLNERSAWTSAFIGNVLTVPLALLLKNQKEELAKEYNIVNESQWPEISRFDPAALAIGLRPGQVAEIIRKSPTALETKYYRLCVSGGLK